MRNIDHELIIRALAGEASEEELMRLEAWRTAAPENGEQFRRLSELWEASDTLSIQSERPVPSSVEIVAAADARSKPSTRSASDRSDRRSWRTGLVAAAIAASVILGLSLDPFSGLDNQEEVFGPRTVVTGPNQHATTTLQDGTVVQIAPGSRLEFSREDEIREVTLDGRAYFAVPPGDERPFTVKTPRGDIQVLGTRFDVHAREAELQVAVVEGAVEVAASGVRLDLRANQVARSLNAQPPQVEEVEDVYAVIEWLGAFHAFQTTPLETVIAEIERRLGISIVVTDGELLERTVTGWFADQSPGDMVAGVCRAVGARCTLEGDRTVHMAVIPN